MNRYTATSADLDSLDMSTGELWDLLRHYNSILKEDPISRAEIEPMMNCINSELKRKLMDGRPIYVERVDDKWTVYREDEEVKESEELENFLSEFRTGGE